MGWAARGPGSGQARMLIKEKGPDLKFNKAGPHTVCPPKSVLLKSNKLAIVTDNIRPFNLYISNTYKYNVHIWHKVALN